MRPAIQRVGFAPPDVTVVLDDEGVVRQVDFVNSLSGEAGADWIGQPWIATAGTHSHDDALRMLEDARRNGVAGIRTIIQRFPSGREVPLECSAVRLGGAFGIIVIGRNLQAVAAVQADLAAVRHSREREAWQHRDLETLYRILFDTNNEPVVVLGADDMRIRQANPVAARLFGFQAGEEFLDRVAPRDRDGVLRMLSSVREQGRAPGIMVHFVGDRGSWIARASIAGDGPGPAYLLQLTRILAARRDPVRSEADVLSSLVDRLPLGFVVLDQAGLVCRANEAFVQLSQADPAAAIGQPLARWLQHPDAGADVLMAAVARHQVVRNLRTSILGDRGLISNVDLFAVGNSDHQPTRIGVLFRPVDATERQSLPADQFGGDHAGLAGQLGRIPLAQLMREAGDSLEQYYIRGALDLANGNRSAAAELLGLSRQTLYVKLARYGLRVPRDHKPASDSGGG